MPDSTIDYLKAYAAMILHGLDDWAVPGLHQLRTQVAQIPMNPEQRQRVAQLDVYLIEAVTDQDDHQVPEDFLQDDPAHPLPQWWWHLGKLRAGTYPAELLPPHLQAMYRQGQRQAA